MENEKKCQITSIEEKKDIDKILKGGIKVVEKINKKMKKGGEKWL